MDLCIKYRKTLFGKGEGQKLNTVLFALTKGGVKNVDLRRNKIRSMQCSWIERLFEDDFHDLKVMLLFLIRLNSKPVRFSFFSDINVNFIGLLVNDNAKKKIIIKNKDRIKF